MPLYEYECEKCGGVFEAIQKFSDAPLTNHEKCGGLVHRKVSAPALQFKGSGWYITDYAKSSGSNSGSSEGENGAPKKKKDGSGSDSSGSDTKSTTPAASSTESKPTSSDKK